jgi:hypothetical protein
MGEQILKQNENLRALNGVSQQSLKWMGSVKSPSHTSFLCQDLLVHSKNTSHMCSTHKGKEKANCTMKNEQTATFLHFKHRSLELCPSCKPRSWDNSPRESERWRTLVKWNRNCQSKEKKWATKGLSLVAVALR